jgi:hypothetical protein
MLTHSRCVIDGTETSVVEFEGSVAIHQTSVEARWPGDCIDIDPDAIASVVLGLLRARRRHRAAERVIRELVRT